MFQGMIRWGKKGGHLINVKRPGHRATGPAGPAGPAGPPGHWASRANWAGTITSVASQRPAVSKKDLLNRK